MGTTTDTTDRVLRCIRRYLGENGYPPSTREIARETRLASTSVVLYHVRRLVGRGELVRGPAYASRALTLRDAVVSFVGEEIVVEDIRELEDGRFAARVVAPMARGSEGMAQAA